MTEVEWLEGAGRDQPFEMLRFLRTHGAARRKVVRRKFRLFACACCRLLGCHLTEEYAAALAAVEQAADGLWGGGGASLCVNPRLLAGQPSWNYPQRATHRAILGAHRVNAADAALEALRGSVDAWARDPRTPGIVHWDRAAEVERAQAELFREVFGNPFRSVIFEPTWRTPAAVALAQTMYDDRQLGEIPVLADALEEAGCNDTEILGHLRGPGPHVLGCWVVDSLLGKE